VTKNAKLYYFVFKVWIIITYDLCHFESIPSLYMLIKFNPNCSTYISHNIFEVLSCKHIEKLQICFTIFDTKTWKTKHLLWLLLMGLHPMI
jgi:hypothetical protein